MGENGTWKIKKSGQVLLRKVKVIVSWESIFLSLREDNVLLFFKDQNSPPVNVLKINSDTKINELSLITITNKIFSFEIEDHESFVINVEDENELKSWMNVLLESKQAEKITERTRKLNNNNNNNNNNNHSNNNNNNNNNNNQDIIICSYNINFALSEEIDIIIAMLTTKAHVIFLQETNDEWENYIRRHTVLLQDYPHYMFHPAALPAGGIAVLSKIPITVKELIDSPVGWFPAQSVIIHAPQRNIQVLNLHLRPPLTDFPNPLPLPHVYITSKKDRVKECLQYLTTVDLQQPLVVLGDFNEDVEAASVQVWTKKLKMKNAYDKILDTNNNTNNDNNTKREDITWHWELPMNVTVRAKFDHIFYHNLQCLKYGVKIAGSSDHYPIFAHFI